MFDKNGHGDPGRLSWSVCTEPCVVTKTKRDIFLFFAPVTLLSYDLGSPCLPGHYTAGKPDSPASARFCIDRVFQASPYYSQRLFRCRQTSHYLRFGGLYQSPIRISYLLDNHRSISNATVRHSSDQGDRLNGGDKIVTLSYGNYKRLTLLP